MSQYQTRRLVSLILCLAVTAAASSVSDDRFETVRNLIRKQLTDEQVPSLGVAVAVNGKVIWEEGFGWADRENRIPANEHTLYSLASISKPFTATALMILKERGKLDLDRAVNDYLGEAKLKGRAGDAAGATVRRVANHTSGLPLHYQFFYEDEPYPAPPYDETIRRYANLVTAPRNLIPFLTSLCLGVKHGSALSPAKTQRHQEMPREITLERRCLQRVK